MAVKERQYECSRCGELHTKDHLHFLKSPFMYLYLHGEDSRFYCSQAKLFDKTRRKKLGKRVS